MGFLLVLEKNWAVFTEISEKKQKKNSIVSPLKIDDPQAEISCNEQQLQNSRIVSSKKKYLNFLLFSLGATGKKKTRNKKIQMINILLMAKRLPNVY